MYCDFYQLSEKPFNITPDPKFLYLNARYREALATLNYGITERKGFITLIGEAGTGKTTLLNKLLDQLDGKTKTVFIFNTNVTFEEILEYIFAEFDLPVHSGKKLYMLQRLNTFLLEELRAGGNVAVLIDEAQDLDMSVLENLRLLSNLETAKEKILQIILSGQPELEQKLSSPELRQLRQRIAVNCRLTPLTRDELGEYIEFRLQAAGCADAKMFNREAEEQVWQFSRGIPRLVNVVCDNALVIGYALGKKRVGADVVREASSDLLAAQIPLATPDTVGEITGGGEALPSSMPRARNKRGTWALFALVAAALVVGFLSMGRRMFLHSTPPVQPQASEKTILHPGQQPADVPPAQYGVEHPSAARVDDPEQVVRSGTDAHGRAEAPAPSDQEASSSQPNVVAPANDYQDAPRPVAPPAVRPNAATGAAPAAPAAAPVAPAAASQQSAPQPNAVPASAPPAADAPKAVAPEVPMAQPPVPAASGKAPEAMPDDARTALQQHETSEELRQIPKELRVDGEVPSRHDDSTRATAAKPSHGPVRLSGSEFDRITVQDGDSFAQIAIRKYGQSSYTILDLLKLANPEVEDINRISAGQTLDLPRLNQGFPIVQQDGKGYGVLAYSTPIANRAQALSKALRSHGFAADVTVGSIGPGRTVQRVIIGPFASEEEASGASKQVQRAFREDDQLAALGRS